MTDHNRHGELALCDVNGFHGETHLSFTFKGLKDFFSTATWSEKHETFSSQYPGNPGINGRIIEIAIRMMMIHSRTSIRRLPVWSATLP